MPAPMRSTSPAWRPTCCAGSRTTSPPPIPPNARKNRNWNCSPRHSTWPKHTACPPDSVHTDLGPIQDCEKAGLDIDFYLKTLHHHNYPTAEIHHDSSFCPDPEEVIRFMQTVKKPWIAFKVMAAGAIPPKDAFEYAFAGGADFVLAGMFDFEIAEDARILREVFPAVQRQRPLQA